MGQEISKAHFSEQDFQVFEQQLQRETEALAAMFERNAFCAGPPVGGLEIEAWLVGRKCQPVASNQAFLKALNNPEVVPELSQFNFELNTAPRLLQDKVLSDFQQRLDADWHDCRTVAQGLGLDVMTIGIPPQLRDNQLTLSNMSPSVRYRALNEQVFRLREGRPIRLDITGREHLVCEHYDVMLEAATTSLQIHLQVRPEDAVSAFNAALMISGPLLAASANAPFLFGLDVLDESRIPLFEQAVSVGLSGPQRVTFGQAYAQQSLLECFEENLAAFPVLIPARSDEPETAMPNLRLHNGTIWRWNRPLLGFDAQGLPHLRIENRVVPAGPTMVDMVANAALFWGAVAALIPRIHQAESQLPFAGAKANFERATRDSLKADMQWWDGRWCNAGTLLEQELIPLAREGLDILQVCPQDADKYLNIIQGRVQAQQNGALWQRAWVACHGRDMEGLSRAYLQQQHTGLPVHQWEI